MDQSLKDAAKRGDIEFLYSSIRSDPRVLDNIDQIPFVDTPLHAAAAAGQTLFALEIMTLKPSFARKLNPDGFTPMHLALQHNQSEVVLRLLYVDKDLVRIQGKGGATPFHCAAEIGNVNVITEFLKACPESITDFTNERETALHLALRRNSYALDRLQAWVIEAKYARNPFPWLKEWLNWKDRDGRTVLEIINPQLVNQFRYRNFMRKYFGFFDVSYELSDEKRNILLLVATLLITVSYQAVLSPPGGLWQENYDPRTDQLNSTGPMNSTIRERPHRAGTVVIHNIEFFSMNTLTFTYSVLVVIFLLTRPAYGSLGLLLSLLLCLLCICYSMSARTIGP